MPDITAEAVAKRLIDGHLLAVLNLHIFLLNYARECALNDMPTQRIKQQVASAIENPDLRKAIRVMDNIREAHEVMCTLPAPILEVLRDELLRMAQDRTGPRGKLKQAWYEFAQQALEDARTRERKDVLGLYQGIKRP